MQIVRTKSLRQAQLAANNPGPNKFATVRKNGAYFEVVIQSPQTAARAALARVKKRTPHTRLDVRRYSHV